MSRNLLLTLAAEHAGTPAQPAGGFTVIRDWLQKTGLDDSGFVVMNGAGLSRDARLTARGLGQLLEVQLEKASDSPDARGIAQCLINAA